MYARLQFHFTGAVSFKRRQDHVLAWTGHREVYKDDGIENCISSVPKGHALVIFSSEISRSREQLDQRQQEPEHLDRHHEPVDQLGPRPHHREPLEHQPGHHPRHANPREERAG
jgi:hypothetical protein